MWMKSKLALLTLALVAGCTKAATEDLVQGNLRLTPPVQKLDLGVLEDGGSLKGRIKDAKGRTFDIFIDYRLGTKTPGAVYLNGEPGDPKGELFTNGAAIKQMLGVR
jgi:hypothetical protein